MSIVSEENLSNIYRNTNLDIVSDQTDAQLMRKALINTETGLKDAVSMLRNDMVDIVSRINETEKRLNQLIVRCGDYQCSPILKVLKMLVKTFYTCYQKINKRYFPTCYKKTKPYLLRILFSRISTKNHKVTVTLQPPLGQAKEILNSVQ